MSKKRKRKGINYSAMRCPYCGGSVVYRSADGIYQCNPNQIMLYVCSHYPECDTYVRAAKGSRVPIGKLANRKLRELRKRTHWFFDQLYQSNLMTKQEAYRWLADTVSLPIAEAHIGYMDEWACQQVIQACQKMLKHNRSSSFEVQLQEDPK